MAITIRTNPDIDKIIEDAKYSTRQKSASKALLTAALEHPILKDEIYDKNCEIDKLINEISELNYKIDSFFTAFRVLNDRL